MERLIRLIERKNRDFRRQVNGSGDLQKIASILARHIGHTPDLPLPPEQLVVVEFGKTVQVNGVDRHHAPFPQTGERGDHNVSARRKGDGAIELDRRTLPFIAHPNRSQRAGQLAMRFAAGGNIHLAVPGEQDRDRQVGGGAEAEQTHMLAGLNSGNAETAKADDARTEQRRGMQIVELARAAETTKSLRATAYSAYPPSTV